ncbi:MAG: HAD family hydrolase [Candidatus Omnitrophota bacterium]|jgi:phosphoglycolate phosphatase
MNEKKLFIFDVDGTLADAYTAIEKSMNFTLKKFGKPRVSYTKIKRTVGRGDRVFIEAFFHGEDIDNVLRIYRPHHAKTLLRYTRLRPGAKKLLYTLKKRKKLLAIASNRPYYFTNIMLKKLGIRKYFDIVLCADQINSLKPSPKILDAIIKKMGVNKEDAVYIGDMDIDMKTARRAKVDAIFITGGSSTLASVKKYRKKTVSNLSAVFPRR